MKHFILVFGASLLVVSFMACSASMGVDVEPTTEGYNWIISDGPQVQLRDCASYSCGVISTLEPGTLLMVLDTRGDWKHVRSRQSGNEGYVPANRVVDRY
ncbi:MAG: hypothetical protein D6E12_04205 [Desulfovibrio sp.]|nr:MAG: hypothetical protein D6E12_04205 [Desulfovibrio sp.]